MSPPEAFSGITLQRLRTLVLILAVAGLPLTLLGLYRLWSPHPVTPAGQTLPYGYDIMPHHFIPVQDFSYNMNFFRQIWEQKVSHPYRLESQKQIVENWVNPPPDYLAHAYSPVALILSLPFVFLPPRAGYLLYCLLGYLSLLALLKYYLLPRCKNEIQVLALVGCLLSYSLATSFSMGQTSLFTTPLLALLWFFWERRSLHPSWLNDLALGLAAWGVCAKPSVGLIAIFFLLGCRLWRALFFCGGFLAVTWLGLADRYGGLIAGLQDYAFLLGHYSRAGMPPFMQHSFTVLSNTCLTSFLIDLDPSLDQTSFSFDLGRRLNLGGFILLTLATRFRWITPQNFFRGLIWVFLLFSPYLLATEDWLLSLFLVGNRFFRPSHGMFFKVLLIVLIANGRPGIIVFWPIYLPLKIALVLWWILETWFLQRKERSPHQPHAQLS